MNGILLAKSLQKSFYYSKYELVNINKQNLFVINKSTSLEFHLNNNNNKLYLIVNNNVNIKNKEKFPSKKIVYVYNPNNYIINSKNMIIKEFNKDMKLGSYNLPFRDHNDYLRYIVSHYKNTSYNEGNFRNAIWNITSHLLTHSNVKMTVSINFKRVKEVSPKYSSFLNTLIPNMKNLDQYNFIQIFLTLFGDYEQYIYWLCGNSDFGFKYIIKNTRLDLDEDLLFLLVK